jgi:hypothetical protein
MGDQPLPELNKVHLTAKVLDKHPRHRFESGRPFLTIKAHIMAPYRYRGENRTGRNRIRLQFTGEQAIVFSQRARVGDEFLFHGRIECGPDNREQDYANVQVQWFRLISPKTPH